MTATSSFVNVHISYCLRFFHRRSENSVATIHSQSRTMDKACFIARQERNCLCDLIGSAGSCGRAHFDLHAHRMLRDCQNASDHICLNGTREHGIDTNAGAAMIHRHLPGQPQQTVLSGGIG